MKKVNTVWAKSTEETVTSLKSDIQIGLSNDEAARRLMVFGKNVLKVEKKFSSLEKFLQQFKSPVIIILIGASILTGFLGDWIDFMAINVIVFINCIIGYLQETKAEEAVLALKNLSAPKAKVLRSGEISEIKASEVCLGDILVLEAGDYVPADSRIIKESQLSADEAVLTGESMPVTKSPAVVDADAHLAERKNMLFASTAIATGSGKAIVTGTGMESEIGKIAGLLDSVELLKTPLQKRLEQVSNKLLYFCGAVVILVAGLGFLRGEKWLDVLMSAISLSVAAIPEGLPTVVTVALALAVRRMSKRNAIVRHLPAVETLGSTSVICTDKTGTLTTGKMRVRDVYPVEGKKQELIMSCVLCSNASLNSDNSSTGDPTEVALLHLAIENHIHVKNTLDQYPRIYEWTFDSNRKRMSVAVKNNDEIILHCKGAPEAVLELCDLNETQLSDLKILIQKLTSEGRRLLAVATKKIVDFDSLKNKESHSVENNLTFLGLVAISDPPREETIPAIKACKKLGIKIIMITGDHPSTAKAIGTELGIVDIGHFDGVMTGLELDKLSPLELADTVESIAVYARVSPEHKLKIVEAWQLKGKVVAMTGDGVNDAPALKQASIGVAMGKGGTEVAKQASSIILTDDNFATIVHAIEEGRAIFGNIRRTIQYLLSGNLAEILIMLGAAVAGWPAPLAPIHLLWINLVTDGLPSLALAAEPVPNGEMKGKVPSSKTFFDKHFYKELAFVGGVTAIIALSVYGYMLKTTDAATARTHVFSFLVFAELFRSFSCRSDDKTFFQMGITSNVYHLIAVLLPLIFQVALHHSEYFLKVFKVNPLSWTEFLILFGLTLIPVTLVELRKIARQR